MDMEQIAQAEIDLLNARISKADSTLSEFADLMDQMSLISATLQIAKEYASEKKYAQAYKLIIDSLQSVLGINVTIIEKIISAKAILKEDNGQNS